MDVLEFKDYKKYTDRLKAAILTPERRARLEQRVPHGVRRVVHWRWRPGHGRRAREETPPAPPPEPPSIETRRIAPPDENGQGRLF